MPRGLARSKHKSQPLLNQILELAAAQRRLRLGPAVETSGTSTVVFMAYSPDCRKTIKAYLPNHSRFKPLQIDKVRSAEHHVMSELFFVASAQPERDVGSGIA
jgi:hypothetical protein